MRKIDWKQIDYFESSEFDDPGHKGSGEYIDPDLVIELDRLRERIQYPIITHASVGGCVDVFGNHGHAEKSYHLLSQGASACDFHIDGEMDSRIQYFWVNSMRFGGVGVYYDWKWNGKTLLIGFHVDMRPVKQFQRWVRRNGEYIYLLGR